MAPQRQTEALSEESEADLEETAVAERKAGIEKIIATERQRKDG